MSDVQGMVNDPDFRGLPPSDQRQALLRITGDSSFGGLSDAETMQFTSRLAKPAMPATPPVPDPKTQIPALTGPPDYPPEKNKMPPEMQEQIRNPGPYLSRALAFMAGGGIKNVGPAAVAEETAIASKVPEPEPVQVGKFVKDKPNPPYVGPRVPQNMELVDSTNVTKVGYHPESKTMVTEYRNGRVYEYRGVPKEIYQQAKDSESVGSYIARNIKGRYETNFRGSVLGKK